MNKQKHYRSGKNWPSTAWICECIKNASSDTSSPVVIKSNVRTSQHIPHKLFTACSHMLLW